MPLPDLSHLLAQLDRGNHGDRVRLAVQIGREHVQDPTLGSLFDALAATSGYHHRLVLTASAAAGDRDRLRGALEDPAPSIRALAFALLPADALEPADVRAILAVGSAADRRHLLRFLNRHRNDTLADAVIDEVVTEFGDLAAGALLATCSTPVVERLLPSLLDRLPSIVPLARRHPDAVLTAVAAELDARGGQGRDQLWRSINPALADLAVQRPGRLVDLLETAGPSWVVPLGAAPLLGILIRREPARVARLLQRERFVESIRWHLPSTLARHSDRFSIEDQVGIARALRQHAEPFFAWIGSLPPSRRRAVFTAALADLDLSAQVWSPHHLDQLPHDLRHGEARRILGLPTVQADAFSRLTYLALLPFADARDALLDQTRRRAAEDRALGYELLVECAARERDVAVFSEALGLLGGLRNEQDPVRLAALTALAEVPAERFDAAAVDRLAGLVTATLGARDTSAASIDRIESLLGALLVDAGRDPDSARFRVAADLAGQVFATTGELSMWTLERGLPAGALEALLEVLSPQFEQAAAADRFDAVCSFAGALGRRAWTQPVLQALLTRAAASEDPTTAQEALALRLADPRTRSARAGEAVAADRSALAVPAVLQMAGEARQDLLDVLFDGGPFEGRFADGPVADVVLDHAGRLKRGVRRWLPRQCVSCRDLLSDVVVDPAAPLRQRAAAVGVMAWLPEVGTAAVSAWLDDDSALVADAALAGLAFADAPAAMFDRALADLDEDRARIAAFVAARLARNVSRSTVLTPLAAALAAPATKVTARKELVRVIGELRPPGAVDVVVATASDPDAHPDVRAVAVATLVAFLDDPRAVELLTTIPSRGFDDAAVLLSLAPTTVPVGHRPLVAAVAVDAAGSDDFDVREAAWRALGLWGRWSPAAPSAVTAGIEDVADASTWRFAVAALTSLLADDVGWSELAACAGRLAASAASAASPGGDQASQRLDATVAAVIGLPPAVRDRHGPELVAVADRLVPWPLALLDELPLRWAALGAATVAPPEVVLVDVARRLADRPIVAERAATLLGRTLSGATGWRAPDAFAAAVDDLIGLGSAAGGTLALSLVKLVGQSQAWPPAWRARLRELRSHPDTGVSILAARVYPDPA